jgi:hypothetical protein
MIRAVSHQPVENLQSVTCRPRPNANTQFNALFRQAEQPAESAPQHGAPAATAATADGGDNSAPPAGIPANIWQQALPYVNQGQITMAQLQQALPALKAGVSIPQMFGNLRQTGPVYATAGAATPGALLGGPGASWNDQGEYTGVYGAYIQNAPPSYSTPWGDLSDPAAGLAIPGQQPGGSVDAHLVDKMDNAILNPGGPSGSAMDPSAMSQLWQQLSANEKYTVAANVDTFAAQNSSFNPWWWAGGGTSQT